MFENPPTAETLPARRLPTILVPEINYTKHAATLQWVIAVYFFSLTLSFCLHEYVRIGFKCCETVSLPSKRSQIAGGSGRTADAAAYCSPYYGNGSFSSFFFAFLTIYLRLLVTHSSSKAWRRSSPRFCPTWPSVLRVPTVRWLNIVRIGIVKGASPELSGRIGLFLGYDISRMV
jgi:hypothetical protein